MKYIVFAESTTAGFQSRFIIAAFDNFLEASTLAHTLREANKVNPIHSYIGITGVSQ